MALNSWQGATITFSTSFFGQITSVRHSGITRDPIPTSNSSTTGAKTFIPSNLYDPGEVTISGYYDNTKSFVTPITGSTETLTITKVATGQSTGGTVAGSAFMVSFEYGGPTDDTPEAATFTAVVKFADDLTFTAGS